MKYKGEKILTHICNRKLGESSNFKKKSSSWACLGLRLKNFLYPKPPLCGQISSGSRHLQKVLSSTTTLWVELRWVWAEPWVLVAAVGQIWVRKPRKQWCQSKPSGHPTLCSGDLRCWATGSLGDRQYGNSRELRVHVQKRNDFSATTTEKVTQRVTTQNKPANIRKGERVLWGWPMKLTKPGVNHVWGYNQVQYRRAFTP